MRSYSSETGREPHASLLAWYRELVRLRRELAGLLDGRLDRLRVRFDETARWLLLDRGPLVVACNLAERRAHVPLERDGLGLRLVSDPRVQLGAGGAELPPESVTVLLAEPRG